jgi:flavin-binding protein dodecin
MKKMGVRMKIQSNDSGGRMDTFWGQSMNSYDQAIKDAISAATKMLNGKTLEWFEVAEFRGGFSDGAPQFQVAIRIGYAS